MTRRIILFLALLLPLQFAWANAAAYCQHESSPAQSRHFGHHEHRHQASSEKQVPGKLAVDNDCGTCHAAGSPVIFDADALDVLAPTTSSIAAHVPLRTPTALARAPDRPQWLRLA